MQVHIKEQLAKEFKTHYLLPAKLKISASPSLAKEYQIAIKKYYVDHPLRNEQYLTQHEIDCLLPFILSIPKKIISAQLNISTRTIETHLENIKNKCGLYTLSQLRNALIKNEYIAALIVDTLKIYL